MLGFDPVTVAAAYILADMAVSPCPQQGPVEVNIEFVKKDNPIITDLSAVQLTQQFGHSPDSTLATDGKWMISGVTVLGPESLLSSVQAGMATVTKPSDGSLCFAVTKVNYTITYSPNVYIASDYKNLGCRSSQTRLHEQRHVDTDVQTITDFIPAMKAAIEAYAPTIGPQGPYAATDAEAQKQRVMKQIMDGVRQQWDQLVTLRRQRQATIDTVQNYMRDTALCPGQFPKFDGMR